MSNNKDSFSEYHDYSLSYDSREIFLGSEISEDMSESGINFQTSNRFIKNVHILNKESGNILVHLNCQIGGEWHYGLSIFDCIKYNNHVINILGYGQLASMSSIIFQSSKHRVLMPNSSLMLHWGCNYYNPHPRANMSQSEWNEVQRTKMINMYVERCCKGFAFKGKSKKVITKQLTEMINKDEDLYLTAEESVYYGLADGIFGTGKYSTFDDVKNAT
jgi:ATP-dependent protease ClpP protease subunit